MRFLLDAQLPPALAQRLGAVGHEAIHIMDRLPLDSSDLLVAGLANDLAAVLMSKDGDFHALSMRGILVSPFVWVRSGNLTTHRLWTSLHPRLAAIERAIAAGEKIIELR